MQSSPTSSALTAVDFSDAPRDSVGRPIDGVKTTYYFLMMMSLHAHRTNDLDTTLCAMRLLMRFLKHHLRLMSKDPDADLGRHVAFVQLYIRTRCAAVHIVSRYMGAHDYTG